jgi:pimeloyl-ACP methyl ester carboxylesterase
MLARGTGFPVLLIPGIPGRWEWMRPTIEALTAGHRVITASLQDLRPERERDGLFTAWTHTIDQLLDQAHERQASVIGVSFGGLIAARYAARRPERVTSLILASTPSPNWRPGPDDAFCLRFPWLSLPYFAARGAVRIGPEIYRARESWKTRFDLLREHAGRAIEAPLEPRRMAAWVREWQRHDLASDCKEITAPTLVLTGESELDRVVPVRESKKYLKLIRGSTHVVLPGTGHIGCVTRPYQFAKTCGQFILASHERARARAAEEQAIAARGRHAS